MGDKINDLINSKKFNEIIEIDKNFDKTNLISLLESMLTIRLIEQKLAKEKESGTIGGPIHLGVGQEAIAAGVSLNLKKTDRVFGAHRSHSHLISLGADIKNFFAEILGRSTGLSKGMGGSMHLWDKPNGFYGSVPIVAGTVPLALGAGFAAKMDSNEDVAIAYLGDSALEEGVVHETLNAASLMNIPIIFIVENNLFGSHMHISQRQPRVNLTRFAKAHDIDFRLVDGNNVFELHTASKELINNARKKNKPGFLEAITYRWYGHVDWREDIDVGVNRSFEDLANWKKRDPIKRLKESMIKKNIITINVFEKIILKISDIVETSWDEALKEPFPESSNLLKYVYRDYE